MAQTEHDATYILSASETNEDGERVSGKNLLREIHDSMCFCEFGAARCDTPGISETLIEAADSVLATGRWAEDFEDGWIKVESVADAPNLFAQLAAMTAGRDSAVYEQGELYSELQAAQAEIAKLRADMNALSKQHNKIREELMDALKLGKECADERNAWKRTAEKLAGIVSYDLNRAGAWLDKAHAQAVQEVQGKAKNADRL